MRKGRKPLPRYLKVLRGNPGKRPLNDAEPQPQPGIPTCPAHVQGIARTEWNRCVKELGALNAITRLDRGKLAAMCVSYGRWVEAEDALKAAGGPIIPAPKTGALTYNPWLSVAHKAMEAYSKLAADFGMDPSSRTRISTLKPRNDEDDEDEARWFKKKA